VSRVARDHHHVFIIITRRGSRATRPGAEFT
jgi:hypothetical protein